MRQDVDPIRLPLTSRLNIYDLGWELCTGMFLPVLFTQELMFFLAYIVC